MKAEVTLGGVPLAGNSGIAWNFVSGVRPYQTTVQCHKSDWARIKGRMGSPLTLTIKDSRGQTTRVKEVYVLHEVQSDSEARKTFVISDRRWKWPYKLVCRDYNTTRKTGDKTTFGSVPQELNTSVDVYDYMLASLQPDQKRWTGQSILEDLLELIEPEAWQVESVPFKEGGDEGQIAIQNVQLRDQADVALARALSYIPGADLFVNAEGQVVVYDATDMQAAGAYVNSLPAWTRGGDYPIEVDRKKIRPEKVQVYYQREMEVLFKFRDDYLTAAVPDPDSPYLENVVQCVDPVTEVTEFDPYTGTTITKRVPIGSWVNMQAWLDAMDKDRAENSAPWTYETISVLWAIGDLEGALGAGGRDYDPDANQAARVAALRTHFRQTFRINPIYMNRVRNVRAVRAAMYDPVTGTRQPSPAWAQACIIPSQKGKHMAARGDAPPDECLVHRNVDYLATKKADPSNINIVATTPAPVRVHMIDEEVGILRIEWVSPASGPYEAVIPSLLVDFNNQEVATTRDFAEQDDKPIGLGVRVESGAVGLALKATCEMQTILTVVPNSPNNEGQLQKKTVEPSWVKSRYRGEYGIDGGQGPELQVFVPPGEMTARFAWQQDDLCETTMKRVLGVAGAEPLEGPELPGFIFTNDGESTQAGAGRHIYAHSLAMAAEQLAPFADSWIGSVAAVVGSQPPRLRGNMAGAAIRIGQAPSAKVDAIYTFPGQQRPISRFALLPEATRQQVLGTLPFRN